MTPDEAVLVDFVVWEMRTGDLPDHVREAALRLGRPRPAHVRRYTEGPLTVDGIPMGEHDLVTRRRCFPHQASRVIRDLLDRGHKYILVQDL